MKKRILAFILMITLFAGNTMSVSATAGVAGNTINTLTEGENVIIDASDVDSSEAGESKSAAESPEEGASVEGASMEDSTEPSGEESSVEETTAEEEESSEAMTGTTEDTTSESIAEETTTEEGTTEVGVAEELTTEELTTEEVTTEELTTEEETLEWATTSYDIASGQMVEDLCVAEHSYGKIRLTWGVANDSADGTSVSFNIYRAESEEGPFDEPYETLTDKDSGEESYSFTDTEDIFNEDGANNTYYYKVSIVSGDVESALSEAVTNKDMYYSYLSSDDMEYVGMYLEDADGNKITSITMRPEEYQEYQLVLVKKDGTEYRGIVDDGDETTYGEDLFTWYICSQPAEDVSDILNNDLKTEDSLMELLPVDFDAEYKIGITAHNTVQAEEKYYLFARRSVLDLSKWEQDIINDACFWVQVPITIVAAKDGESFTKMEDGASNVYLSAEELSEGMRTDMVERKKTGVYYVKEAVYEAWVEAGGTNDVYDFNREREGMKPDEGDYLFWQNFDPEKIVSIQDGQWIFTPTSFNGENWYQIDSNQVYFTTEAQEKAVTEKIDWLLRNPAGDLYDLYTESIQYYEANGSYSPEKSKEIADTLCDYVYKNTKYYGTPQPEYHSAWSAIINKRGTCQAYALFYTRLLREFGIANKILGDGEKNAHAYNIVQIDAANDIWYYYDATGGVKYKTEGEYSRAPYQDLFLEDPVFIENYISKIKGSSYAPTVYLYGDGDELLGKYFSVTTAAEAMKADAAEGNNISYTIELNDDADVGMFDLDLPSNIKYCKVELNGHTLTARNGAVFAVDEVNNGTVKLAVGGSSISIELYAPRNNNGSATFEKVKFVFDQNVGGFFVNGSYPYEYNTGLETPSGTVNLKGVTISKNSFTELYGDIYMDEASALTTGELTLSNSDAEATIKLLGTIKTGMLNIPWGSCAYDIGNLSATGNVYIPTGATINVYGALALGNTDISAWEQPYEVYVNVMQEIDNSNNVLSTGTITFTGSLTRNNNETSKVILGKKVVSTGENGETAVEEVKFGSGETMATVKKDNSLIPLDCFGMANAGDKDTIIRNGNKLVAARATLEVSFYNEASQETLTKEYISLETAVASLKTDFAGKKGAYTFTFVEDAKLNANVTIPSFVTELTLQSYKLKYADSSVLMTLDFGGYSVTTGADTKIYENLRLINTGAAASKFTFTGKNGADGTVLDVIALPDNWIYVPQNYTDANYVPLSRDVYGYTHISNVSIAASNGTVAFIADSNERHKAEVAITAKEVLVSSGYWDLGTVTVTNFTNNGNTYVNKINNVQNVNNKAEKILVVDTYTQKSNGKTNLESGSRLVVKKSASIYNTVIGGADGNGTDDVYVYRMPDAADGNDVEATAGCSVAFEGKMTRTNDDLSLQFGVLNGKTVAEAEKEVNLFLTNNIGKTTELPPRTVLFTSKISAFPVELIRVNQLDANSNYRDVYQQDTDIMVGREWIVIYTKQADGSEELLKSFLRWSDAASYLNTLSNSPMEYVVELLEDIDSNKALTMPSKTGGITFRGKNDVSDENPMITITYTGDLKLLSDTTFENIRLEGIKYNSKKKIYEPYQSKVTLNGKTLTFIDSEAEFYSIAGNSSSRLVMKNSAVSNALENGETKDADITVTKGVTSLGFLDMDKAVLTADNVTVTNTLSMTSSEIACKTKITVKNIESKDAKNVFSYGGNKNLLTISGSITAGENGDLSDEEVTVNRIEYAAEDLEQANPIEINKTAVVRKNAITLKVNALEDGGYKKDVTLASAVKAGAGWFVVGSSWADEENPEARTITFASYKRGNTIYCGEIEENVRLYSADTENGEYAYESSFATLQEAFSEIDKLAVTAKYYRVELVKTDENVVTFSAKGLTFPSKAAGVILAADRDNTSLTAPAIFYKGNLTIKCNTTFEDITLVPTVKGSVSLGNYSLTLTNCTVDTSKTTTPFSGISGSSVKGNSALILDNTVVYVSGAVNNIGKLVFTGEETTASQSISTFALRSVSRSVPVMPALTAEGKVNVGNIELETDGEITGLATVTRRSGKITQIAPQITINGEVYDTSAQNTEDENAVTASKTLYVDLLEKKSGVYETIDFNASEAASIKENGIRLAKASLVTYPNIKAKQASTSTVLVKSSGCLTYFDGGYAVVLSFVEDGKTLEIPCRTFSDAVTEINSRKAKNDYTITLTKDCAEISGAGASSTSVVPKSLTMPNKNYVNSLVIQTEPALTQAERDAVKLGFLGNITFTSEVTLDNVHFVQMIKSGSVYKTADTLKDDYPGAVTIHTGGFDLHVLGKVTINTPLILNGGSKAKLKLDETGTINTQTNGFDPTSTGNDGENIIYGQITGFNTVTLDGLNVDEGKKETSLTLKEYKISKYTASSSSITNLNLKNGTMTIVGDNAKGALSVTNLAINNGEITVGGKANLKNVSLEGTQRAKISADTDFNITGTLTSLSNNAALYTRLKGSGKAPYLNISGTVIRGEDIQPIYVGVKREWAAGAAREEAAPLYNAPKVTAQLLTAKTAPASDFQPVEEADFDNYQIGGGKYSADNLNGYMMMKSGSNVYVYDGSKVRVAVYRGDLDSADLHNSRLEETDLAKQQLFGYFTTFKDATTAVNALKNKKQTYTYVLMSKVDTVGTIASPMAVSLPSYAKKVTVTSLVNSDIQEKSIYLSGSITLASETEFKDVVFAPVYKSKATTFNMAAGGWNLTLTDVAVSEELDGKMALKDISGNGKQTITLNSDGLTLSGSITNAANVIVKEDTIVKGTLKTTDLTLENIDGSADAVESGTENLASGVTLTTKGTVTIGTVYNIGTESNTLEYSRTSKSVTRLTINKEIVNKTDSNLLVLKQADDVTVTVLQKKGVKASLSDAKKLAVMPKASTDSFTVAGMARYENGTEVSIGAEVNDKDLYVVKANKGIYLADATLRQDEVMLTRTREAAADSGVLADDGTSSGTKTTEYACLDYAQAVNEINNQADKTSSYTITFKADGVSSVTEGASEEIDTVVTDGYADSGFAMPKANMAAGLIIEGALAENGLAIGSRIPFTGNITGYGNVTMRNLVLNPAKSGTNPAPGEPKLTFNADKTAVEPEVLLENITTVENDRLADNADGVTSDSAAGFIHTITGTKNKTRVTLRNCGSKDAGVRDCLILKSGISNLAELRLENTNLLSAKASTLTDVRMDAVSSWNSLDKLTVMNIYVPEGINDSYIGIRQDKNGNPLFVVNGDIFANRDDTESSAQSAGILQCKVYPLKTTLSADDTIFAGTADITNTVDENGVNHTYKGVYLASAKKATADRFRAYAFRMMEDGSLATDTIAKENLISYKVGAYVVNGDLNDMAVKITERKAAEDGALTEVGTFYATSYDNAVTIIQNKADKTSYYELELLSTKAGLLTEENGEGTATAETPAIVMTTKNGTAIGGFTIPDKAKAITIVGQVDNSQIDNSYPATLIKYTGTLKANVDVTFKNLILTEGKADKKEEDKFKEYGTITLTPGSSYTMSFDESVYTYDADKAMALREIGELQLASASSSKGKVTFDGNQVSSKGSITLGTLTLINGAAIDTIIDKATGKINIANVFVDNNKDNRIASQSTLTLGNISSIEAAEKSLTGDGEASADVVAANGELLVKTAFAKTKKVGAFGNPQLTVSGLVENTNVRIQPSVYDLTLETPAYREMEEADFDALLVKTTAKPSTYMKFATMPKATLDTVSVVGATVEDVTGTGESEAPVYTTQTDAHLYKYETGLYLTNLDPQVKVTGYLKRVVSDAESSMTGAGTENSMIGDNLVAYEDAFYEASFLAWDQAVKEIDKINDKTKYYEITLLENVGEDTPVGTLTLPSKAAEVMIRSDNAEDESSSTANKYGVFFTGSTISVKCNTRMEGIALVRVKVSGKGAAAKYTAQTHTIHTGNFHLLQKEMESTLTDAKGTVQKASYAVAGSSKGIWEYLAKEGEKVSNITKISGVGNVIVSAQTVITGSDPGAQQTTEGDTFETPQIAVSGDLSTQNITLMDSGISAKNITISNHTTLAGGKLQAGTAAAGDGKLTLKNLILLDNENQLAGKQDKSGKTQININGILYKASEVYGEEIVPETDALADGTIEVALYYNNRYKMAQLHDGMTLLNAQKFPASLFVPAYTKMEDGEIKAGMGLNLETPSENRSQCYALYKSGKAICYGKMDETREVRLTIGDSGLTTYFASFEEAVKEIGTISLYKDPTAKKKEYEDYTITLLQDVEIGNAKKNNSFSSISLPNKAANLVIEGDSATEEKEQLRFWGNVTLKCNTEFKDITLLPLKKVSGNAIPTAVNYAIGNYTLRMTDVTSQITTEMAQDTTIMVQNAIGESLIGNITGSSKTGTFIVSEGGSITLNQSSGLREIRLENGAYLHAKGNVSVYQITFGTKSEEGAALSVEDYDAPVLEADGKLTVTLFESPNNITDIENEVSQSTDDKKISHGIIRKPVTSVFTWNGVYEDRDKTDSDKTKKYYSLILPEGTENGCVTIELMGTPCPIGTTIVTGKYLVSAGGMEQIYVNNRSSVSDVAGTECNVYVNGTTFYVADKNE